MTLHSWMIADADPRARQRLARALGLPISASAAEISEMANAHQTPELTVAQLEIQRRTMQLMATRGMTRTAALWQATQEARAT